MLPSALVQLSVTFNNIAPAKVAGVVTASADGSFVATVQLPSPLLVPVLDPIDGRPVIVRSPVRLA